MSATPPITGFETLARRCSAELDDFFFIQVGANDGRINDPIFELVNELGWRGVLLEPQRWVFENRLLPNYAHRSGLSFENAAIDERDGTRDLFTLPLQERWATGLASFERSHLVSHVESGYVDRALGAERHGLPEHLEDAIVREPVRTLTFGSLLEKYRPEKIDLLQIDAEGYDHRILELFPFDRFQPTIVHFECHVMTADRLRGSLQLLNYAGYVTLREDIDVVSVRKDVAERLDLQFDVGELRVPL